MGRERIGPIFDVESVSIATVYQRTLDEANAQIGGRIVFSIQGALALSGDDLLVGSVPLLGLYEFLKSYRDLTEDLDQLYEKNVRRFLGARGKVNRRMQQTLQEAPELFGLYNNGITIVVSDFTADGPDHYDLVDPYIVNGCQTTRTIWQVFQQRLDAGGSGMDPELDDWRGKAERGSVVAKIVKVGTEGSPYSSRSRASQTRRMPFGIRISSRWNPISGIGPLTWQSAMMSS